MTRSRVEYADMIVERLQRERDRLRAEFTTPDRIATFVIDDLLPEPVAREIYAAFPPAAKMLRKHSLKESKRVAAQLDRFEPIIEEITLAFQDPGVVRLLEEITGIDALLPDPHLYAGGISSMGRGDFLNPHIDNSHDGKQENYRVLNSLYYVTPDWAEWYGGHLELWDRGLEHAQRTVLSRFNRLVLMATHRTSWHSVSPILHDGRRCCVSNYYFRTKSLEKTDYFHATYFRGRPEQRMRDLLLRVDGKLRTSILSVVNVPTKHIYKPGKRA